MTTNVKSKLERRVMEIVADAADVPVDRVRLDQNLFTDLGVDSLGVVSIRIDLKREFGIPEPASEAEYRTLDTPQKLIDLVRSVIQ